MVFHLKLAEQHHLTGHHILFIMNAPGSEAANEEILQDRLRVLLDRLQWSYINLWTLNPRTRVLEWKRGHFELASAKAETREYAQLLYTTYNSCCFAPGVGAVGRAYLEGRHLWLTNDTVCQLAGSVTSIYRSQFLRYVDIKTTMCIQWVDSVLEIGTSREVAENWVLMDRIHQILANDLLSVEVPVAPECSAGFEHELKQTASGAAAAGQTMFAEFIQDSVPRVDQSTNLAFQSPASILQRPPLGIPLREIPAGHLSLAEQVWRSANNLSLSLSWDFSEMQTDSDSNMDMENLAFGQEAGTSSSSVHIQTQDDSGAQAPARRSEVTKQAGLMVDRYGSLWSGEALAFSSIYKQQQQHHILADSSAEPHSSADDRTSTSSTFHSQLPGPRNLNQLRRTNSCGDQNEIQKCHTLSQARETFEQWSQQLNPASELAANADATVAKPVATNLPAGQNLPLQGWQGDLGAPAGATLQTDPSQRPAATRSNVKIMNKVSKIAGPYLRKQSQSALELLKDVDTKQKEATEFSNVPYDVKAVQVLQEPSKPAHVQINRPSHTYPSGQRRTRGVEVASNSDPVHSGHAEAAASHMLAERQRRKKQKENFITLRRLVPLISKADKVSTLTDTITYLTFLQNKIQAMEANNKAIDHRCEILENRCKGMRDRNQELVEMISRDQPAGSAIHLNLVHLKLQALDSL